MFSFLKKTQLSILPQASGTYEASADWNVKKSQLEDSGFYCVYNGTGGSVTVTNLQSSTRYYGVIFTLSGTTYSTGCA